MISVLRSIVLAAALAAVSDAAAHERIALELGRLTDAELEIVRSYFAEIEEPFDEYAILRGLADTPEKAWEAIRREWLYGGHYDVDGDGRRELIVYIGTTCGTVGCQTIVLREQDGVWSEYLSLIVSDADYLCVGRSPGQSHADVYSYYYAQWWNGREYWLLCLNDCEEIPDWPGEAAARETIKAYGECGTAPLAPK